MPDQPPPDLYSPIARIDPGHRIASGVEHGAGRAVRDEQDQDDVPFAEAGLVQLHSQASQLAQALRARRQEINQREAQLNARVAQLENELRGSRLWISERDCEYREREKELLAKVAELEARLAAAPTHAATVHDGKASRGTGEVGANSQYHEERLADRVRQLAGAERRIDAELQELADQRAALARERRTARQQAEHRQSQLAQQERELKDSVSRGRSHVAARQDQLDRREAALQALRDQTLQASQQVLEMRLVVQQSWMELVEQVPPAELTRAIARARQRLADQYGLTQQELAQQRKRLEEASRRLDEQTSRLRERRGELEGWLARRNHDIEEQAARLIARERELDREQQRLRQLEQRWFAERHELEQQIRRQSTATAAPRPLAKDGVFRQQDAIGHPESAES